MWSLNGQARLLEVHLGERRVVGTAGADQHVVDGRRQVGEEALERSRVAGVEGRAVNSAELLRGAIEALGIAGGDDDVGALGACRAGGREADAGAAADHDDGLAEQGRGALDRGEGGRAHADILRSRPRASRPGMSLVPYTRAGRLARQRIAQGPARADPELGEHLLEVPLDGARTEEELGADLRVRATVASEPSDLLLLGRQLVAGVVAPLADLLAGGQQLVPGALGEAAAPMARNASRARRSCSRASTRRPSRRSHSP